MSLRWTIALALGGFEAASAATLNVPADYPTIQAAIDAAHVADTVRVAPGRYEERLVIIRDIVLESRDGPATTTIDAKRLGTVVKFTGTTRSAFLRGFTITGGMAGQLLEGGGVEISFGAASIVGNVIIDNLGAGNGNGISMSNSHALISSNKILNNANGRGSGGGGGGGIGIGGSGCAGCGSEILNNVIAGNSIEFYSDGGGILLNGAGPSSVIGNIIAFNTAPDWGGGISIFNGGNVHIENNLIVGNATGTSGISFGQGVGGGVYWRVPASDPGPYLIGNTIADNEALVGSAVYADGADRNGRISNNIMVGAAGGSVLECSDSGDATAPSVSNNDVFAGGGAAYGGLCAASLGAGGNVSLDPGFIVRGDYRLRRTSPAIDAGSNAWVTTSKDVAQRPRIHDDNGDSVATVDMGAYEFDPDPLFHDSFESFP